MLQIYIFPLKPQKKSPKNLQKREIFLIFAADFKHNVFEFPSCDLSKTFRNVLSSPLDDIVYTVDIDEEGNHHNFQAHSIEDLPEGYLPTEDSYYEFEPPCPTRPVRAKASFTRMQVPYFLYTISVFPGNYLNNLSL